jgi:CRISPR-associated protein Cmr6
MEQGILKIKPNGKIDFTINGKPFTNFKLFDFSGLGAGTHNCEVVRENGLLTKVTVNGKDIAKNENAEKEKEIKEALKETRLKADADAKKQAALMENRNGTTTANDSLNIAKTRLPKDVRSLAIADIDNFNLKLNKAARFETVKDKSKFHFYSAKPQEEKDRSIGKTTVLLEAFQIKPNFGNLNFAKIAARQTQNAINWLGEGNMCKQTFTPDWRIIVGLGGASVYETSMTLHHIYGVPYIPASSIKGVVRSHIIAECFQLTEEETKEVEKKAKEQKKEPNFGQAREEKALQDNSFCLIFGSPAKSALKDNKGKAVAHEGNIIFFDAFPTEKPCIVPDVMTPHYDKWYGDKKDENGNQIPPADYHSPIPVFFLTVENTPFEFVIGTQNTNKMNIDTLKIGNKTIAEWLSSALKEKGIGAKTAVGYGYMQ